MWDDDVCCVHHGDGLWEKNSCVCSFWRPVLCSAYQRAGGEKDHVQGDEGSAEMFPACFRTLVEY